MLHVSDEVLKFPLPPPPVGAGLHPPSQSSICKYLCLIILSTVRVNCAKSFFQEDPYIALDNDTKVRVTQM